MLGQAGKVMDELARSVSRSDAASRDEMLARMGDLFTGVSHLLDSSGLETFDAIFVSLVPACSVTARKQLSDKVARNARGPRRAVRHLAFDDEIVVARPIITLSPLLLDEDQLALATVKSLDHLAALCERDGLKAGVTDIILSRADGRIRVALATNRSAELSEKAHAALSEIAVEDDALHDALEARGLGHAAGQTALPASSLPPPPNAELAKLDIEITELLLKGETDLALAALAKALAVPPTAVSRAFAVDIHGGFLAYARAANLFWDTTEAFLRKRYETGNLPPRLQRAARDFEQLSLADARRVVTLLVKHAAKATN